MRDDLPKRLRKMAGWPIMRQMWDSGTRDAIVPADWLREAADEIERLRAAPAAPAQPEAQPVALPTNAAQVRSMLETNCERIEYAHPLTGTPDDDDRYTLTAHDLLSALDWWQEAAPAQVEPQPSPPDHAEFEIHEVGDHERLVCASTSGPRDQACAEAMRYAAQYAPDGPIEVYEVTRRKVDLRALLPAPSGEAPFPTDHPPEGSA